MKILKLFLILAVLPVIFAQCTRDPRAKIQALERKMSSGEFNLDDKGLQTAGELIQAYIEYAESHKESPEAPVYLYKAADLSLNINNSRQAMDIYNRIIYQYPEYDKVPESLFLIGYIYENFFQELGKAKEVYENFLARYPDHDFADDARVSIENLGKSPEELIRLFEEKNKNLSDSLSV